MVCMQIVCKPRVPLQPVIIFKIVLIMAKNKKSKSDKKDKEKVQKDIEQLVARSLARRFPLFETGRCVVGFLKGMVSSGLTDCITDLLRGHSREMQNEIADSIRIYCLWQEIDLTGVKHVDDVLEKIFDWYDDDLNY